jgi:hypothetical protein
MWRPPQQSGDRPQLQRLQKKGEMLDVPLHVPIDGQHLLSPKFLGLGALLVDLFRSNLRTSGLLRSLFSGPVSRFKERPSSTLPHVCCRICSRLLFFSKRSEPEELTDLMMAGLAGWPPLLGPSLAPSFVLHPPARQPAMRWERSSVLAAPFRPPPPDLHQRPR